MLIRLVCLLALSSLCLSSPLGQFEKELKKKGFDVDKIHEELKRESGEVGEEFAGKETQEALADLRAAYSKSTDGTNEVKTEMEINGELSEDLFEGDIILTPEQRARLIDRDARATLQRRHAVTDVTTMWIPMGNPVIPYSYADGFPDENKKIITESLEFWASRTCITFRPANETDKNIIEFNHNSKGCGSVLGMVGGKQEINLAPDCFTMGIITHELSHAFGTMHIHSRADRDDYINVNTDNIEADRMHEFAKDPLELGERGTYNIPYEFGSLMHYEDNFFAINENKPTIYAKRPYTKYQHSMGSPLASFYDVLLINRMYKCTAKCKNQIECDNNGVQDGSDCNRCYCPKGWAGTRCEERPGNAQVIEITERWPSWFILMELKAAPIGRRINATFEWTKDYPCHNKRFFEIVPTKDTRINGIRFCGNPDSTPTESDSNHMLVYMYNRENKKLSIGIKFDLI